MGLLSGTSSKKIYTVKVLGVRTAENTGFFATYNSAVYCVLIEYEDGTRAIDECSAKDMMKKYVYYIDMDT